MQPLEVTPRIHLYLKTVLKIVLSVLVLYIFLFSIQLMGSSLKLLGEGFTERMLSITANPVSGLLIGILVTAVIQSSSTTTSLVVGLVAAGGLSLGSAIPIIMGANIGTTVTNVIVSFGHVTRKEEFQRAFAGSIVHDIFNVLAVIILFPLELKFHLLEKSAGALANFFVGIGGIKLLNPLKLIIAPLVDIVAKAVNSPWLLIIISLALLLLSLVNIVKLIRSLVMTKMKILLDYYLFRNDRTSFGLGLIFTALVQSSSATTSLVVPIVGSGLLSVRQIFPYTLGANVGTTVTALLAALSTLNPVCITVAFTHLLFNVFGIIIIYPFKKVPIYLAQKFSGFISKTRKKTFLFIVGFVLLYVVAIVWIISNNLKTN